MFNTYFLDVIKNHYIDFGGKATRTQYWLFVLFYVIIGAVLSVLGNMDNVIGTLFAIVYAVFSLGLLLPALAIQARRLRDGGFSPWWLLLMLTGIGALVLLVMYLLPSKK